MEVSCVFASVLSHEEWAKVPRATAKKLETFVTEKFEEFISCKALLETSRYNADQALAESQERLGALQKENEDLKRRLEVATATVSELEAQISQLTSDASKLQSTANRLEAEAAEFRHQRNMAVDERDEHLQMLQRRDSEIERLQADLSTLTKQLEGAVNAKCEALAQADEVASMKLRLEYREKRMEQERQLLNSQIETLTEDLNARTEELLNMRRDNTSRCIQLETKLTEKTQELVVANEQIKSLTELNNNFAARNEELSQKLLSLREADAKMNESYLHEIEAKTKLANAYKSMCEESQQHAESLKEALAEVQQMLKHATDEYGELETKHKEMELTHEEILAKKNECITLLKKELETSKELLENCKQDQIQKEIEGLSPSAASASRLLKSGMTVTEIYTQYVTISERLIDVEKENAQLKNYISSIVHEVEEKGPLIKKLREDYSNALDANEILKNSNDQLLNEIQQLREANVQCTRVEEAVSRENARYKKEVADLSRQVCHLLQEIENSRVGSSSTSTDMDLSDSVSSADIITKKLVTFNDISELQKNNQKLLAIVRELTERQEEAEAFDPAAISDLKMKLDHLRESQNELLEERERHNKMMITLGNQRDMYKNLYTQAVKAAGEEVPSQLDSSFSLKETNGEHDKSHDNESQSDDKTQELLTQIESFRKKIEHLKNENELYRKEKSENEKILLEQLENMRAEVKELVKANCKLLSQQENSDEKFKIAQNNIEIYKKQITALEKQNKIYSETIIKHEQAITYLKDETMQSQTKLARAEVMLANLQKENALLKDAEMRLLKERESIKRESHTQNMIQSNIELIKATLERTDAEGKLRLEARLDEAHRECAALRRRLQEEQDRFRQLSEHLESQTQLAKQRMGEEQAEAEKLRKELANNREELIQKANQIEDLTKKLKTSAYAIPESNIDGKRIRELEQQLSDAKAEIEALSSKLKTSREAAEQYSNVASNAENQMTILMEKQKELEEKIESQKNTIKQLQEKCAELEGELSLQMDDQDMANASTRSKSTQLEEELNVKNMDLQTAREQLENIRNENKSLIESLKAVENKFARQVMLHSADLQMLTDIKADYEKATNELIEMRRSRDCALEELDNNKASWETREKMIQKEREELEQRFKDMDAQNSLLLDQIQALNTQLSVLQAQATAEPNQSADLSMSKSFTEDEVKSSEQLLTIIKYLRQEKDIAVSKSEIMEAEYERLKSQHEMLTKQLEEAKAAVETERQKSEVSVVTAAKHAEVLRKVETLNAITDSNRALRQERDTMKNQISELKQRAETLAAELAPTLEKNRELNIKAEAMQTENISLRAECTKWRQRAQMLIEKSNRTSPEDWKKLLNERETLAKQLTIERGNVAKITDEVNTLKQDKGKLEEQLRNVRSQNNNQAEEIARLKEDMTSLQNQMQQLTQSLEQTQDSNKRLLEENRLLTEHTAGKDVNITELKNNLTQIRKIAKKYKIQCEDQINEIKTLREEKELKETEQNSNERQLQVQRSEMEERISQIEQSNKDVIERLNQQVATLTEENENYKKEIESHKQGFLDREERFKNLFKNAKERIVTLTEQMNTLRGQLGNQESSSSTNENPEEGTSSSNNDLLTKIDNLEKEKANILADRRQENEKYASEIEALMQKVSQLQRQLGQQGSKPSTSSGSEKPANDPPTANIKPMAGHSTNTQTQSVPIHPWRSGETPLASIRPMSQQVRTVTVLPTSQSPSAVMVPPQQQVHTTGSSTIEALSSSSPTSSHTDYVPATSSASPAMLGPRQVVVPPTQSSQDTEDEDANMQSAPQQQAVALVLPRVEPPSSGPTQEQGTSSSSSSNTVTTTQAGLKRQRDPDTDTGDEQTKTQQQSKRTRVQQAGTVSDSGLEVEYQVPTSSQRDHDDDNVIVVESDEEGGADEGEGADDEPDDPDTEGYDLEVMEQDNYEDADCQDVEDEEGGNEVEVIEDSSEVPNQSERSLQEEASQEESVEPAQPEATSSGTDGGPGGVTLSQASTSVSMTMPSFSRTRPIAPLLSRQQQSHLLLSHGLEEGGDDGIVPSTPTLFVPRRSDGFGEAVSSPHVPTSGRFTFNESVPPNTAGSSEIVPEQTLEVTNMDENSTGRSVPSTPLQASPQEAVPGSEEQGSSQTTQSDAEIPSITVSGVEEDEPAAEGSSEECMGPPSIAGTSAEGTQEANHPEESEGYDGVTSEGEKQPSTEEGEEEGREAEASPSTNTRSRSTRAGGSTARRSGRQMGSRGVTRSGPTPIVWGEQRNSPQHQQQQQRHSDGPRGRPNIQSNYAPRAPRRARGRAQRPYGRF
ncbi:nucleoprotein TPR isoform X2 [Tribolium castaneum]|uniref:Nucleoprotein TPR n=1 Tax=Tribolium castaneum TaxID=7070 RepID=D6WGQ0_TRICA|nr:PREDICTED: nucleoprotein TPR isoform X2 [Tribolium castaneum]EFA01249.2 megator [Tribolium castaneum]|eukprot:XP_008193849.1 PREDICTED: nucleoprotein TPR isoform X2 [Tribolium castaneum]